MRLLSAGCHAAISREEVFFALELVCIMHAEFKRISSRGMDIRVDLDEEWW